MNEKLIEEATKAFGQYLRAADEAEELQDRFMQLEAEMAPEELTEYSKRLRVIGEALDAQENALEAERKQRFRLHRVK